MANIQRKNLVAVLALKFNAPYMFESVHIAEDYCRPAV